MGPFLEEEIKFFAWDCGSDKSIGLDGYNFGFLKHFWEDLKVDFVAYMKENYVTRKLENEVNNSFVALIQKKEIPQKVSDYKPISLIECMYKVGAKVLENRMRKDIHLIIKDS